MHDYVVQKFPPDAVKRLFYIGILGWRRGCSDDFFRAEKPNFSLNLR